MQHDDKMKGVDKKSVLDNISEQDIRARRLSKTEALKKAREIVRKTPESITHTGHCLRELANDNLTTGDVLNVLKSPDSRVTEEPDFEKGSWRYRLGTKKITTVISFSSETSFVVVTAWRNKNEVR